MLLNPAEWRTQIHVLQSRYFHQHCVCNAHVLHSSLYTNAKRCNIALQHTVQCCNTKIQHFTALLMFQPTNTWHSCSLALNFWVSSNIFLCVWASSLSFISKSCTFVLYIAICSISSVKQSNTCKIKTILKKKGYPIITFSSYLFKFLNILATLFSIMTEYGLKLASYKKHHKDFINVVHLTISDSRVQVKSHLLYTTQIAQSSFTLIKQIISKHQH